MNHFDNDPGRQFFALMQQSGLVQFSILYASDDYHSEQATKLFNLGVAAGFDVSICSAPLDITDPYSAVRTCLFELSCHVFAVYWSICLSCFARVHLSASSKEIEHASPCAHFSLARVVFRTPGFGFHVAPPRQANNATIDRWTALLKVNAVAIIVILTGPTQAEVAAYKLDQGGVRVRGL
jgi:hypothetical protein